MKILIIEDEALLAEGLEELISFSFHAEGWDDVELTLYSYDSGSCLVEINGEALAFTERSQAEALRRRGGRGPAGRIGRPGSFLAEEEKSVF